EKGRHRRLAGRIDRGFRMAWLNGSEWALFRRMGLAFAIAAVALALVGPGGLGNQTVRVAAGDAGFVVFSAVAAWACARTARSRPRRRRLPWWLLCGSASCYFVGNSIWFYYQVFTPQTQPFPGPADIFYVAQVPFAVAAMLA